MKRLQLKQKLRQSLTLGLLAASVLALLATACTSSRDPSIKNAETKLEVFAIADIDGKTFDLQTEGTAVAAAKNEKGSVLDEKPSVKIASSSAPDGLQNIFKDLVIKADTSTNLKIKLAVRLNSEDGRSFLHVLRQVDDEKSLTEFERQSMFTLAKEKQKVLPLFKVSISAYGQLCREKDANGDDTTNLIFCKTAPENATHVQLSVIKNERSTYLASDDLREIFLASSLHGKVSTLIDLEKKLDFSSASHDVTKVLTIVSREQGSDVSILIFGLYKKSDITDKDLLGNLKAGLQKQDIRYCDNETLSQLPVEEQKDCVLVLKSSLKAQAQVAEVKQSNDMAEPTIEVAFKPSASGTANLLKIAAKSPATEITVSGPNSGNIIRPEDVRNKEFLLRRTFEDGAASIQVYGPGASGQADIVKFEFEDDRMVVRRATSINGMVNPDQIDREELMSIPVVYMGVDPNSSALNPKFIRVNKDTAKYALLDWTKNTLPVINSPLSYFEDGQCFGQVGSQTVTDVDNRIKDGVLNFSISGSYSFTQNCMSFYGLNDYWYGGGLQAAFNIKERVSFKLHTGELDKKIADLPFRAQNLMNFGVFTAGEAKPDNFGNQGHVTNELAHPVIHDFSNGKQLVYSLGGLPEEGEIRTALIEGTKEVVKEWNDGLHMSFKGTDLDREGDYVVLKIDGIDQPVGHLGDLDRNYIWNYQKNLDSGLLGMSQAAPNPRSGLIEQNNILMYSGNLLSQIGSVKEMARVQKEYQQMKAKVLASSLSTDPAEKDQEQPSNGGNPDGGLIFGHGRQVNSQLKSASQMLISQMNALAAAQAPRTPMALNGFSKDRIKAMAPVLASNLRTQLAGRAQDLGNSESRKNEVVSKLTDKAYLQRIFQKAMEANSLRDETALNALSAAEILKAYGKKLAPEQKLLLAAQSRRLALMAEFEKSFRKGPNCAIVAGSAMFAGSSMDPDLLDDSKTNATFKSWYKSTLLHEMGHSLGLTHNFAGSTDKENFVFKNDKDANKERNYSSIMDYIPDQYIKYHGPGLYDLRALRVAYTGLIEIDPASAKNVKDGRLVDPTTGVDVAIKAGSDKDQFQMEIKLADLKTSLLGDRSWWTLTPQDLKRLPLKHYNYCTDMHVGGDPSCNRWDLGSTNLEIAQFYANEYRSLYPVLNARGTKLNIRSYGSYVSRLFYEFGGVRAMVDETFYLIMTGKPQEAWLPTAYGAIEGLNFFTQIINTPTVALPYNSLERFEVYENPVKDEKGQLVKNKDGSQKTEKIVVESKPNQDLAVAGMPEQTDTRGIEIDKAISLMMLTQRGTGNPRYESISLRTSFAEFEKFLLQAEPSNNQTLQTVKSVLADNQDGTTVNDQGDSIYLPRSFQPQVTELIRYYAGLSAGVLMDADTLEDKFNFAALFRTSSSQESIPKYRFAVTKLDQSLTSSTSLKLWSLDNASISDELVRATAQKRALIESSKKLVPALIKVFIATKAQDAAAVTASTAEAVTLLTALNRTGLLINKEESADLDFDTIVKFTVSIMGNNDLLADRIAEDLIAGKISQDQLSEGLASNARVLESQSKSIPYVGIAQKALLTVYADSKVDSEKLKTVIFASYMKDDTLESNHGMVVNNLGFLNKILFQMYPELERFN